MMLIYGLAILIIGHWKGKKYENKKRQQAIKREHPSSETRKTQESFSNYDQKEPSQYPT